MACKESSTLLDSFQTASLGVNTQNKCGDTATNLTVTEEESEWHSRGVQRKLDKKRVKVAYWQPEKNHKMEKS